MAATLVQQGRALLDALNARDLSIWQRQLADTYTASYPGLRNCKDAEAARAFNAPFLAAFSDLHFQITGEATEGERTYAEIKDVGENIETIIDDLVEELDLDVGVDTEERCAAVADALDNPENFEAARQIIRERLASEGEKKRERKKKNFVASQINKAKQALEAGETETGCTVHLVNEDLDSGRILAQAKVPINPDDTVDGLFARIQVEEHKLLPKVLGQWRQLGLPVGN